MKFPCSREKAREWERTTISLPLKRKLNEKICAFIRSALASNLPAQPLSYKVVDDMHSKPCVSMSPVCCKKRIKYFVNSFTDHPFSIVAVAENKTIIFIPVPVSIVDHFSILLLKLFKLHTQCKYAVTGFPDLFPDQSGWWLCYPCLKE